MQTDPNLKKYCSVLKIQKAHIAVLLMWVLFLIFTTLSSPKLQFYFICFAEFCWFWCKHGCTAPQTAVSIGRGHSGHLSLPLPPRGMRETTETSLEMVKSFSITQHQTHPLLLPPSRCTFLEKTMEESSPASSSQPCQSQQGAGGLASEAENRRREVDPELLPQSQAQPALQRSPWHIKDNNMEWLNVVKKKQRELFGQKSRQR